MLAYDRSAECRKISAKAPDTSVIVRRIVGVCGRSAGGQQTFLSELLRRCTESRIGQQCLECRAPWSAVVRGVGMAEGLGAGNQCRIALGNQPRHCLSDCRRCLLVRRAPCSPSRASWQSRFICAFFRMRQDGVVALPREYYFPPCDIARC